MTLPDKVFRHAPGLRGLIADPETSFFRPMRQRYAEWDEAAGRDGRPADWRLDHAAREKTRHAALDGRLGADLWVFAFGSLIWDPAVHFAEIRRASLPGWRRSFCMHLEAGRGSDERPGLMCALDAAPGQVCEGAALRIPAAIVDRETEIMWMREMITGAYVPRFLRVETADGEVDALAFCANHAHHRHVELPLPEQARRIAAAEGVLGTNFAYLDNMLTHLEALGIHDEDMASLHAACLEARKEG